MQFTRDDTKVIKGIAIVLMLYHHLFYFPQRISDSIQYIPALTYHNISSAYLLGEFGKICVALFLFLGGYGTFLSFRKHADDDKAGTQVVFTKIKYLYAEYWKVFIIFVPICLLAGVERVVPDISAMIWNFSGLSISYCGEWWFFTTYVALLFTYPIGRRLICNQKTIFHDVFIVLMLGLFAEFILPCLYSYKWAAMLNKSLLWSIFSKMLAYVPTFYMGCIFAKYDLLSMAKKRFSPGIKNVLLAFIVLLAVFFLRRKEDAVYDFLFAPIVTVACTTILSCRIFKAFRWILEKVGRESTTIWLVHSIYCYLLCQKIVFLPRYTFLIFLWLLLLSFCTSVVIRKLFGLLTYLVRKKKKQAVNE